MKNANQCKVPGVIHGVGVQPNKPTTYLNECSLADERGTGLGRSQLDGVIAGQAEKLTTQLDDAVTRKSTN